MPVTARSLGKFFFTDGDTLVRCYKDLLIGFREWNQQEHASDWILLEENIGERLSIDETSLQDDLFTFLSNKDGHCISPEEKLSISKQSKTKSENMVFVRE